MFEDIGEVEEEHNGNVKVTLKGHAILFHSPSDTHMATLDEVTKIRRLINSSKPQKHSGDGAHLLLVIDHKEAMVYHMEIGDLVPERILPYDPLGHKTHVHSGHPYPDFNEEPNNDAYFDQVLAAVKDAGQLLIFGSGSGSSGTMDQFLLWLSEHHPDVSEKVVASEIVDQTHLTEGQLLHKAREIYGR